jgi:hypothetical protein
VYSTGSVKNLPAHPRAAQPFRFGPRTTRCNDTGSVKKGNYEKIVSGNAMGWSSSLKVESTIQTMMENEVGIMAVQETWSIGNWEKEIRGYLVIHHNYEARNSTWSNRGRERRGVAIILSPMFKKAYERAGRPPPITTSQRDTNFVGRFIGIALSFPKIDTWGKRIKGEHKFFVASIYHPFEEELYDDFNDTLIDLLKKPQTKPPSC